MDETLYKDMWYRISQNAPGRWRYAVMVNHGDRPIKVGETRGDSHAAIAAAKIWIDILQRAETDVTAR